MRRETQESVGQALIVAAVLGALVSWITELWVWASSPARFSTAVGEAWALSTLAGAALVVVLGAVFLG